MNTVHQIVRNSSKRINGLMPGDWERRLASGALWSLVGAVSSQGLRLLAFIVAARILGTVGFGQLGMVQTTILVVTVFSPLGLGLTAARHLAQYRTTDRARAGRIFGFCFLAVCGSGLLFAAALVLMSGLICGTVLHSPELTPVLRLASPMVLGNTLIGLLTCCLSGLEAFRSLALACVLHGVFGFAAIIVGVASSGLDGAIAGLLVASVAGAIIFTISTLKQMRKLGIPMRLPGTPEWRLFVGFSLPAMLGRALTTPVQWLLCWIVVSQPGGVAEWGVFCAADQWKFLILFIPSMLERSALPMLADFHARRDYTHYQSTLRRHVVWCASGALLVACLVAMASPLIMQSYGAGFGPRWLVLVVIGGAATLGAVNTAIWIMFVSTGTVWHGLISNGCWAICLVLAGTLLIPSQGSLGVATAYLLAWAVQLVWQAACWNRRNRAMLLVTKPEGAAIPLEAGLERL